jgi:hypothetical protein
MLTKKLQKVAHSFCCEKCNYTTSRKSSYNKHILSAKHKMTTNVDKKVAKSCSEFICCNCNKIYKSRQTLHVHKKKCSQTPDTIHPAKDEPKLENTMVLNDSSLNLTAIVLDLLHLFSFKTPIIIIKN